MHSCVDPERRQHSKKIIIFCVKTKLIFFLTYKNVTLTSTTACPLHPYWCVALIAAGGVRETSRLRRLVYAPGHGFLRQPWCEDAAALFLAQAGKSNAAPQLFLSCARRDANIPAVELADRTCSAYPTGSLGRRGRRRCLSAHSTARSGVPRSRGTATARSWARVAGVRRRGMVLGVRHHGVVVAEDG